MDHYQKQEHRCFMCRDTGHFMRDCPHCKTFCAWHKEHLNSLGWARRTGCLPQRKTPQTSNQDHFLSRSELGLRNGAYDKMGGTRDARDVLLEGCKVLALADSCSQVNTMMPEFIQERGYLVLPLDGLVNYPLHLVGLGG